MYTCTKYTYIKILLNKTQPPKANGWFAQKRAHKMDQIIVFTNMNDGSTHNTCDNDLLLSYMEIYMQTLTYHESTGYLKYKPIKI